MRFLRQTSPAQLRLGWLRVIAAIVGKDRISFDKLRATLDPYVDQSNHWLDEAGFIDAPRGNVPKSHIDRLARMGTNYGIQAEDTTALTDLGHVLRCVSPWIPDSNDNPLKWQGAARWIGFWIVLQAAGDILIPLLRAWPAEEQTTAEAAERIAQELSTLARQGQQDDRGLLRRQAESASPQHEKFSARATLYPYIEPLRDLGYLTRTMLVGGGPGYRLTAEGIRLRDALRRSEGDTESLLRSGISRVFLLAEGFESLHPAPGPVLADVLATMPPELTVLRPEEVPLDPAVLLTQAKLLREAPGTWIDRRRAHDLLKAVGQRGAKVEVKRGGSVRERELNVAWESAATLADYNLWDVDIEDHNPLVGLAMNKQATATGFISPSDPPTPIAAELADHDDDAVEISKDKPAIEIPADESLTPDFFMTDARKAMLRADMPTPVRLWLQYIDSLLDQPRIGDLDLPRWGGLEASLTRISSLLSELSHSRISDKRSLGRDIILYPYAQQPSRKPHCLRPLLRIENLLYHVHEDWLTRRIHDLWLDGDMGGRSDTPSEQEHETRHARARAKETTQRDPLPVLERGRRHALFIARKLRTEVIEKFLDASPEDFWGKWDAARQATRCIIQDAIANGAWSTHSLRVRLHRELCRQDARGAARCWLDLLFATPRAMIYTQRRRLPLGYHALLDLEKGSHRLDETGAFEVRIQDSDHSGSIGIELVLRVSARSESEAITIGRQKVQTFLTDRYAARVTPAPNATMDLDDRPDHDHAEPLDEVPHEHIDREEPVEVHHGLPGRSTFRPASRYLSVAAAAGVAGPLSRGDSSLPLQRILRAKRELLDARRPGLRGEQRVMWAWMAMERLVTGGKEAKGEAITLLSTAASLIQLRAELTRILHDARAGLWFTACLEPESDELRCLANQWLSDLPEHRRALIDPMTSGAVRRARAMDPVPHIDDNDALRRLWEGRSDLSTLKNAILKWAPLTSAGLHDFLVITGDGQDKDHKKIGDGRELAKYFREIYEDTSSLFAQVYEMRNRTAHGGGAFDRDHDPAAMEAYHRFVAFAEPVLDAAERWVNEGMSLEQVWGLAIDKAQDLAGLPHSREHVSEDHGSIQPTENAAGAQPTGTARGPRSTTPRMAQRTAAKALSQERVIELLSF